MALLVACNSSSPDPVQPAPIIGVDWARAIPQTPDGGAGEPGYVGSAKCQPCHETIDHSWAAHGMARTGLRRLEDLDHASLIRIFDAATPVLHAQSGFSYRPFREGDRFFVEETRVGDAEHSWIQPVTHAMGSGDAGMAFYFRDGDRFFQIPLDWFPAAARWGLDPGFANTNLRFSFALDATCVACHTDPPRRSTTAATVFFEPMPSGIGCERCHGPGAKHVATSRGEDIVNPSRLSARQQIEVCAQCHQDTGSVYMPGREPFGYRPGDALDAFRRNHLREPPEADRVVLLDHPERMTRSACYLRSAGKLTCTTCHDPHASSRGRSAAYWRERCTGCHVAPAKTCTEAKPVRAKVGDDCVPCHMRRGATDDIPAVSVVDHWIQVRPPPIRPGPAAPPARIVAWSTHLSGAEPQPDPEAAAASAVGFDFYGKADDAEQRAQAAVADHSRVPEAYEIAAGHLGARGKFDDAARTLAKLLAFQPDRRRTLMAYALAALDAGTPAWRVEAEHALDRMIALDPRDQRALEVKGMTLVIAGRWPEGKAMLVRAAAAGPAGGAARVGLAALALHDNDRASALRELEAAHKIEPRDPWIRMRLAALGIGAPIGSPPPPPTPVSAWLPSELR